MRPATPRNCEYCGKVIPRSRYADGQWEPAPRYARRRVCSRECMMGYLAANRFQPKPFDTSKAPPGERALFATLIHLLDAAGDKGREIGEPVDIDLFLPNARDTICDLMRMPGRVVGGKMEWEVRV
jgi:hypothetical protein